jgi:hypothetical protein
VEYLFVIWEGGEGAEPGTRQDMMAEMGDYVADLVGKGKLKGGAPLQPATEGATIRRRRGKVTAVDGPFLETKEVIGGYFLVEADSINEAVELAKACPGAAYGAVEVREIMQVR